MNTSDLFGGVSSDEDDSFVLKPTEKETEKESTNTLMADLEMSDDSDTEDVLSVKKSESPVGKPVKFFLSSDDDSQDMPDIDEIIKYHKEVSSGKQISPANSVKQEELEEKKVKLEVVQEPPKKKIRVEEESEIKPIVQPTQHDKSPENLIHDRPEPSQNPLSEEDQISQMKHQILLGNMSTQQLEQYTAYRRSRFQKSTIRKLVKEFTGGLNVNDNVVITIGALAKMLVGDIVEEALDIRDLKEDEADLPLKPHHIRSAYMKVARQGQF
ncbi:hypothetical protein GCK72_016253 [Caenorhabditis remanei]|uniref:Transcription initiation factor TFIID subunit 11 n=2 Tax=Caenorhabditis remanei TaxID=31234 RepID=A0A6A5GZ36_CAERE|nr:hypothetical protein GCK72_016253 [Caenorhabditis remanei]KAF1759786.1 hypothetical protein GCK72_016253 [Caenorhabditis remanei]